MEEKDKTEKIEAGLVFNKTMARGFLALEQTEGELSGWRVFKAFLSYGYPSLNLPSQELGNVEAFFLSQLKLERDSAQAKYDAKRKQASEAARLSKGISRNRGNQNARKFPSPPPPQVSPREDLNSEENRSYMAFLDGTETAEQKARREANFSQLESEFDKIAREKQERASSDEFPSSDESSEEDAGEEIREPQTPKEKQLESDAQTIKDSIAKAWKVSSSNLSLSWRDLEKLPQLQNIKGSTTRELLRRCSLEKQTLAAREFIAEQGSLELGEFLGEMLDAMARSGWRG